MKLSRLGLAIVGVLAVACSGKSKPPTTAGAGSGSSGPAIYGKKISLSWAIQPNGSTNAEVFLAATDETGKAVSYPIGTYDGQCAVATPAPEMKAVIGVHCSNGKTGTDLHAVIQSDGVVIVLKLHTEAGVSLDPMAREEVTRISTPLGAKVEAGS